MKPSITSLLLVLFLPPSVPGPNPVRKEATPMHEALAHVVRSTMPKQFEQLSLFDPLVVSLEVVKQDIQAPADQRSGAVAVVGQFSNLLQLVDVVLSQSQCNFLNHRLHGHAPEDMSSVHHEDTQRTCKISANVTGTLVVKHGAHFDVPSFVPPPSEDYLKVTSGQIPSPEECDEWRRSPLDQILGRPRADHRDKSTLEQVKRARESKSKDFLQDRVLARLEQLEAHEPNTSFKSDYRQAFICVSLAAKGNTEPFLSSSYAVHGIHQDKVWPRIVNNRKERLGREYYQFFDSNDLPRPDVKWDETVIYDLPTLGAPASALKPAPETGDGSTSSSGPKPSPVHPINQKEGIA